MRDRSSSPPAPTCHRRRSCRSGCPGRAPTSCNPTPSSRSTAAASGMSSPIDCRDRLDRQVMRDQAQFQTGDDPVANLSDVANTATTNCTDARARRALAPTTTRTPLRISSGCATCGTYPRVALVGIGNGAQVALAYAASRPDKVARLILDSPVALGINAEAAAEQQVKGQQAALDAFAAQCVAVNCALGSDPKGAVSALLADARAGKVPGGASVAEVANAITVALGFPSGGRVDATTSLANALAAARSGDANQLNGLINRADAIQDTRRPVRQLRAATPSTARPRTGSANWSSHGASSTRSSARSRRSTWSNACTGRPVRRRSRRRTSRSTSCCWACRTTRSSARGSRGDRGHRHQRQRGQQAGDVAGHRPRRQYLFALRGPAAGRLSRTAASCPEPTRTVPPDTSGVRAGVRCAGDGS